MKSSTRHGTRCNSSPVGQSHYSDYMDQLIGLELVRAFDMLLSEAWGSGNSFVTFHC